MNVWSNNNKENIGLANINEQKLITLSSFISQNELLNKLSLIFKKITFSKSKFLIAILVLKTRYKHSKVKKKTCTM